MSGLQASLGASSGFAEIFRFLGEGEEVVEGDDDSVPELDLGVFLGLVDEVGEADEVSEVVPVGGAVVVSGSGLIIIESMISAVNVRKRATRGEMGSLWLIRGKQIWGGGEGARVGQDTCKYTMMERGKGGTPTQHTPHSPRLRSFDISEE